MPDISEQPPFPPVSEFFAPDGTLARASKFRFEHRPGQYRMALFVEKALIEKAHLVAEAGTGTGKTLAYLYPALRYAIATHRRVIVSTGTKGLQEQLFYKDVPFLQSILGDLAICYLKGRSNYLCRQKLIDIGKQGSTAGEQRELNIVRTWEQTTETGDRAELKDLPETSALWGRINARSEACTGKSCGQYDKCFVSIVRKEAENANLVIINHHLFFTDLMIKMKVPEASILPSADVVIFDEAHELEHVASDCFGLSVSNRRIADLANDVNKAMAGRKNYVQVQKYTGELVARVKSLWDMLPGEEKPERFHFAERGSFIVRNQETYTAVLSSFRLIFNELRRCESEEGIPPLLKRVETVFAELRYLLESNDAKSVFWIERTLAGRGTALNTHLQAAPIDVSDALAANVFDSYDSVILTSATLTVQQNFEHVRRDLGIAEAGEIVVPSVFDYQRQAMLYLPPDMPDPRSDHFFERAKDVTLDLLDISRGRAFCLFTSYEMMQKMYRSLQAAGLPYPLLLHGSSTSRKALLEQFRATPNAVLLGTSSFWQGIDVQGEQLSCVIIDRLPFAVPSDPIVKARLQAITEAGGNGFFDYQIPKAVIALNQGFGRLIRSMTDRGVLAMLDPRIQHPRYGKIFLESLPPYRLTKDRTDLVRFMASSREDTRDR
jgi:ATP-dependent DNA helicase DinG